MKNKKALLVIDMQKGLFTEQTPRYDADGVIKRINTLSSYFRALNFPVIFIQHDGTGTGEFEKNTEEWELLDILKVNTSDSIIDKRVNDAFYNSDLLKKLTDLEISNIVITGCATDFCVASTIQSALVKDLNITVISDGHTTGNRPHLSAEKIIEHYNWIWQNMIPTQGSLEVVSFESFINKK